MPNRPPNLLLILSDQEQHWNLLPSKLDRPGLNWLLDRGTGYDSHHVVTLPCGPSRSTIYTGLHTTGTGVVTNPGFGRAGMSPEIPTIGSMLREHGYYTAYKGKWHVSEIPPPGRFSASTEDALEPYGFSEFTFDGDPVGITWDGYRQDPAIAADAANWLLGHGGRKPGDRPWFLAVNFVNPHDVMFFDATGQMNRARSNRLAVPCLPAPLVSPYTRKWDLPLPVSFGDDLTDKPAAQQRQARAIEKLLGVLPHSDEEAWRALRSYYLNCLTDLDRSLDVLVRALVASGHDRDTVVVYTTDHGEMAGAHGLREKPTSLYREVVNVPLVVVHPDVQGGMRSRAMSSAIDLAPSLLHFAGVDAEHRGERHPQLRGHELGTVREEVLFCMDRPEPQSGMRGIFDGRWKFACYDADELELYDTLADPDELVNLAIDPEQENRVRALTRRLAELSAAELH